ncbi:acyl-ACP--UDP-N-acetylglucosamine O-acyltransferase [Thermosulfurimonas marina]|uniref:Acyl-[acyl-carrier-protein]--UDP-N-acetylglucosamine O-acyltransferase n=1 Tax=Thermosulfurimonas marina TaxID=2047767 RepID=A0A6H1WU63_9BACT|nr:acyl-ACP--UDP-N-acetylglucosamine O-acyltransferase [Thermosulfurimonas marina]QJA06689.1 acyl-ACP--UDP-N-acetylglucosamine O-acyltransferase [Thermosulfurimonas marina]
MPKIHPTAIVDPSAEIEEGVEIGPYAVIGPQVYIGRGTRIGAHVVIEKNVRLGRNNLVNHHAILGADPQHLSYKGEKTWVEIGDENVIREFVTIHRGTALDQGLTRIGNRCLLMAYVHIAHDCFLGNEIIMANGATLGGHVRVGDRVVFGGLSAVHQFCRIGAYAFVSGMSGVDKDVPPFVKVFGIPAKIQGVNLVGLRRAGFEKEAIRRISQALGIFLDGPGRISEVIEELRDAFPGDPHVEEFVRFLENPSRQGIMRRKPFEGEEAF